MKVYREVEVQHHSILTSVLDGCEWFTSRPGRCTPVKKLKYQAYHVLVILDHSPVYRVTVPYAARVQLCPPEMST